MMLNSELVRIAKESRYKDYTSLYFLRDLVRGINPDCVLELGTFLGASAAYMASAIKDGGRVISIDNNDQLRSEGIAVDTPNKNLQKCNLSNKVRFIEGSTQHVAELLPNLVSPPEIIFMDAHHEPDNMWKEYHGLASILPKSHVIVIDDLWPIVCEFVSELTKKYPFTILLKDFHQGMAIVCTHSKYLINITQVIGRLHD